MGGTIDGSQPRVPIPELAKLKPPQIRARLHELGAAIAKIGDVEGKTLAEKKMLLREIHNAEITISKLKEMVETPSVTAKISRLFKKGASKLDLSGDFAKAERALQALKEKATKAPENK